MDEVDNNYKEQKAAMSKKMAGVKGKIATEVKKDLAEKKDDKSKQIQCDLAYRVFHEGMEMYKDGEMSFKEFADDLHQTLLAIE